MARRSYKTVGQAAAGFAVALLLSLGFCGVTFVMQNNDFAMVPGLIGLLGIVASTLGLVVMGIAALILFLLNYFDGDKDEPQ